MINYPNGKKPQVKSSKVKKDKIDISISSANRGMELEKEINISNQYYLDKGMALIYKRPTPINVCKVDYSKGARITDAYFEKQSTTDYNGVYKGKYLDFEAKNTKSKTSFPLNNISNHQIAHLEKVLKHEGIAFFIIRFETLNEVYLLEAKFVIDSYKNGDRKSISIDDIKKNGYRLKTSYRLPIDYLEVINEIYFKN